MFVFDTHLSVIRLSWFVCFCNVVNVFLLQLMHDAEMSNTQSLTLGRSPRHRTVDASARYATAPRHSSADSRISPYRLGENGNTAQNVRSAGRSPRSTFVASHISNVLL